MKQGRMRTTLMGSLLAVSLDTFRSQANQSNRMLTREAALLADLPSLKNLMSTQDAITIQDGSGVFWEDSGSDFFALTSMSGKLFTYSNRGSKLSDDSVKRGLQACMS